MALDRFMKVYSNLPINVRSEVVLVISHEGKDVPITWDVAYMEICNKTSLGNEIMQKLVDLNII